MFRRRRIFRPIIPLPVPVPVGGRPQVHPAVARAHSLMEQGQYPEAAAAFSQIAEVARSRGGSRAPFFFIQAGRATVLAGQVDQGIASIRQGLELLAAGARWPELQRVGQAVVDQLTEMGYPEQAGVMRDWLASSLEGKAVTAPVTTPKTAQRVLPTRCPSCGASVNSKEIEWLDALTAECLFCGGPIRAES